MRCACGVISSCQSAAIVEILNASWHEPDSCKQRYSKQLTFTFSFNEMLTSKLLTYPVQFNYIIP